MSSQAADAISNAETFDLADFSEIIGQINNQYQRLVEHLLTHQGISDASMSVMLDAGNAFQKLQEQLAINPLKLFDEQMALWQGQLELWQNTVRQFLGEEVEPVVEPGKGDRRFLDPEWTDNVLFNFIKQYYLLFARCIMNTVHSAEGVNDEARQQIDFYARQFVNAMSPSNFVATNPEVLRKTIETRGQNLLQGMQQLVEDLRRSEEGLNVSMTDFSAFEVGKNVATTPGKVVYQNDLMQLLQYAPTTKEVYKRPLLVVPPWINKFYILDLREKNSLIKWLVDQGHTVFVISWINPGPELRDKNFQDYMLEGPLAALDAIEQATGEKDVNVISYCIGGTLTAATLAYMAEKQDRRVVSATYMTTLLDFSDPGEIGVFINDLTLSGLEKQMERQGYLDGRALAFSFNLLRENDLFWSFFINNYLKGERPQAFDLLYWNSDGTNMPYAMHSFYLRNMYQQNKLVEPGGITLVDTPIDLRKIKTPVYFVSTIQDHIAKWTATYKGVHLHSGEVTFVLSGSGHIAGIVNPPAANKYGYWTNDKLPESTDAWFAGATKHEGSWWPHWQSWLESKGYVSEKVAARKPGSGKLKALEDAPGSYVKLRILDVIPTQQ